MPRQSPTDNVRKRCGCAKWKTCGHPWYIFVREGTERAPSGKIRARGLRQLLSALVGREPRDFADAKAEAKRAIIAWRDRLDARSLLPGDAPTVAELLEAYSRRPGGAVARYRPGPIVRAMVNGRPFGQWRAAEITREMVEAFQGQRPTVAGNRDLALLRGMFNWAVPKQLVAATPFKVGTVSVIKLAREEARTRRLQPGEEPRLLLAAGRLHDLIVAALETGCRQGELLSLQWHQVSGELFLPAGKTKAKKPRRVPISTVLQAVLDARRHDPAGDPLPPAAFVFGDEVGRRRRSLKTAWRLTCRRATIVGLHFHDLRREAGSRWMDAGVPLATIQRWLGHHNISQTSTYLAASGGGDADAMRAFEQTRGRIRSVVPYGAVFGGSNGPEPTQSHGPLFEKTEQNPIVH